MKSDISVIMPLYNKERSVGRALRSVLVQTLRPLEVVIVDDGSTDGSAAVVEQIMNGHPEASIKLIRQANEGVSAARNRAIAEACGRYVALLDADDSWTADHLAECRSIIEKYPDCGACAASFRVDDGRSVTDADTPQREGVLDFFAESLERYVMIPSAALLLREAVVGVGGFPVGMRMGEDQYLWTKLARRYGVCFSPARTVVYSKAADNRSAAIYRPEECEYSFEELLSGAESEAEREYIARVALGRALLQSAKGGTEDARRAIRAFGFTRRNRRALRKLKFINGVPLPLRMPLLNLYNRLAWAVARKGL